MPKLENQGTKKDQLIRLGVEMEMVQERFNPSNPLMNNKQAANVTLVQMLELLAKNTRYDFTVKEAIEKYWEIQNGK